MKGTREKKSTKKTSKVIRKVVEIPKTKIPEEPQPSVYVQPKKSGRYHKSETVRKIRKSKKKSKK